VRDIVLKNGKRKLPQRGEAAKKIEEIKQENIDLKKRFELALESQTQMLFERTRAEREAGKWLKAYRSLQDQQQGGSKIFSAVFDK